MIQLSKLNKNYHSNSFSYIRDSDMKASFILLFLFASPLVQAGIYRDCGSKTGTLLDIEISGCSQDVMEWCPLKKGTDAQLIISFKTLAAITKVKATVHGIIGALPIPFPLPNNDGCVSSNLHCPLEKDANYIYNATLPVLKSYPKLSVTVQWELKDENDQDIICVKIPTKIV